MPKPAKPQILTANRLLDGEVVYWAGPGRWMEAIGDAQVLEGEAEAKAAEADAAEAVKARLVVAAYLFEVRREGEAVLPVKAREAIRAQGPTVRRDLGKQARRGHA